MGGQHLASSIFSGRKFADLFFVGKTGDHVIDVGLGIILHGDTAENGLLLHFPGFVHIITVSVLMLTSHTDIVRSGTVEGITGNLHRCPELGITNFFSRFRSNDRVCRVSLLAIIMIICLMVDATDNSHPFRNQEGVGTRLSLNAVRITVRIERTAAYIHLESLILIVVTYRSLIERIVTLAHPDDIIQSIA